MLGSFEMSITATTSLLGKFLEALKFYLLNHVFLKFTPYWLRTFYIRSIVGIAIGKETSVALSCFFTGNNILIGNNTVINRACYLDGRGPL
jgi:acetyltransferase-like isoleucine patch superfamily enzyme